MATFGEINGPSWNARSIAEREVLRQKDDVQMNGVQLKPSEDLEPGDLTLPLDWMSEPVAKQPVAAEHVALPLQEGVFDLLPVGDVTQVFSSLDADGMPAAAMQLVSRPDEDTFFVKTSETADERQAVRISLASAREAARDGGIVELPVRHADGSSGTVRISATLLKSFLKHAEVREEEPRVEWTDRQILRELAPRDDAPEELSARERKALGRTEDLDVERLRPEEGGSGEHLFASKLPVGNAPSYFGGNFVRMNYSPSARSIYLGSELGAGEVTGSYSPNLLREELRSTDPRQALLLEARTEDGGVAHFPVTHEALNRYLDLIEGLA